MVYGAALAAGAITPGTALRDAPIAEYDEATGTHWKPRSGNRFRGVVLAQDAFAASLNAPAIDVFDRVGAGPVIDARPPARDHDRARRAPADGARRVVRQADRARPGVRRRSRGAAGRSPRTSRSASAAATPRCSTPPCPRIRGSTRRARLDRIAATAGADPAERVGATGGGAAGRTGARARGRVGGRVDGRVIDERVAFQLTDMMSAVVARGTASAAAAPRAARRRARPARPTTTPTPGSSASPAACSARCGSGSMIPRTSSAPKAMAPTPRCRCGCARCAPPRATGRPSPCPGPAPDGMERVAIDRETGLLAAPGTGGLPLWFRSAPRRPKSRGNLVHRRRISAAAPANSEHPSHGAAGQRGAMLRAMFGMGGTEILGDLDRRAPVPGARQAARRGQADQQGHPRHQEAVAGAPADDRGRRAHRRGAARPARARCAARRSRSARASPSSPSRSRPPPIRSPRPPRR